MQKTNKVILAAALGLCLLMTVGGLFLRSRLAAPLGPRLELGNPAVSKPVGKPASSQETGSAASGLPSGRGNPISARNIQDGEAEPAPAPTAPAKKPICGWDEEVTLVLGIGADRGDYLYGLADVIRVARLDFVTPSITMVSLPRDLWVEIPGIEATSGFTHGKLNQAYFWGGLGMGYYDSAAAGPGLLAQALYHNYGIAVDHYAAVNISAFSQMVDAVGGIEVILPFAVGREGSVNYFHAGRHKLSGKDALFLARYRGQTGDFRRQDIQSAVMLGVGRGLLSPSIFPRIPQMTATFLDKTMTDLSPEQIGRMACLLNAVGEANVVMTQLPSGTYTLGREYSVSLKGNTSVVRADPEVMIDYLEQFVEGTWP
jgi:LCP family protein required for cell wall assembly